MENQILLLFKEVDKNNTSVIEKEELFEAMVRIGLNPTAFELDEFFEKFDKDLDGAISYTEFRKIIEEKLSRVRTLFNFSY